MHGDVQRESGLSKRERNMNGSDTKWYQKDAMVIEWYNTLKERSEQTARNYRNYLLQFDKFYSYKRIIQEAEEERRKILVEYSRHCKQRFYPKTVLVYLAAIRSWLKFNGKQTNVRIEIPNINQTPTIIDERIPTPEAVRELLLSCNPRQASIASLIAFSGLRFESQSKITLQDLLDLDIDTLQFKHHPALVYVPAYANKTPIQYFTFLTEEGSDHLSAYLEERKARGEQLTKKSNVIASIDGKPMKPTNVGFQIARLSRRILEARPYILRAYFDTALLAGRVHPRWQSYFMGHRGDLEAIYTTKKHLPETIIEPMREAFRPAVEYLTTAPRTGVDEARKRDMLHSLEVMGILSSQELETLSKRRPRDSSR